MGDVKYIRTKDNQIVVFSSLIAHSKFRALEPISAGFILIRTKEVNGITNKYSKVSIECYGESISLNLKSDPMVDSELARLQILGEDY